MCPEVYPLFHDKIRPDQIDGGKMMKENELMIGDLVYYYHNEDGHAPYEEVTRIEPEDLTLDAEVFEVRFKPIPLAPEILVKNGFVYTNNHTLKGADTYICRYKDYELIYKLGDYFAVDSYDDRYYRLFETQFCYKWSVHELQHALRLCKIDKEIVL